MEFFLDTGVFLGLDPADTHHEEVSKFFEIHERKNDFYSAKIVKKELNEKKLKLIKQGRADWYIRRIFQIIRLKFEIIKEFVDFESHKFFQCLYNQFYPLVKKKSNDHYDASILANAFLWEYEAHSLNKPILVTVDNKHFYNPRKQLYNIAMNCTNQNKIKMKIRCVWDVI